MRNWGWLTKPALMCNGFMQKALGDALHATVCLLHVLIVEVDVNVVVVSSTVVVQPHPNARNLWQSVIIPAVNIKHSARWSTRSRSQHSNLQTTIEDTSFLCLSARLASDLLNVIRYINPRYLLTYLLTYSQPVLCDLDLRHPLYLSIGLKARRKGKGSGFILRLTFNALKYGSQFYLQITPYLSLRRKRSPDDATADYGGRHLIAAYYSFIDPERMKGWVGLVGWPTADGLPT